MHLKNWREINNLDNVFITLKTCMKSITLKGGGNLWLNFILSKFGLH